MKRIALIFALAAFTAPVFADGQRVPVQPPEEQDLDLKARDAKPSRAAQGIDRTDEVIANRCNKAGGGMMTTNEGTYRCVGPDGANIPNY